MLFKNCSITLVTLALLMAAAGGTSLLASGYDAELAWLDAPEYAEADDISVVVFFDSEPVRSELAKAASMPKLNRADRLKSVTARLRDYESSDMTSAINYVNDNSRTETKRLWITPAIIAVLSPSEILAVSRMPSVIRVVPDIEVDLIAPVETKTAAQQTATSLSAPLQVMNIPYLWNLGITGRGALVCSFDTGVDCLHPALEPKWRGNKASLSASWFSTITPDSPPSDRADHGTHTMGVMVGHDGADTIGVAPDAEWITAGVIDQGKSLPATFSDILAAFQWALDPDGDPNTTDDVPDVILNSWGVPTSLLGPCDETFFAAIDNVEAAGVVCIFSAGNEGPNPSTLRNPAIRATTPLNAFAIGAVDNLKQIASFSSRGPGGCDNSAIKPEIVAPGVSIRSAAKGGGYKVMTGTSQAAPFVAGLVALCRQINPEATVEEIKWALIHSAEDLGATGEDNAYGYGLPDASKLIQYLVDPERPHFILAGSSIDGDGYLVPGETANLRVSLVKTNGEIEQVSGIIDAPAGSGIEVVSDQDGFVFGLGGTTAVNLDGFVLSADPDLPHGSLVELNLTVADLDGQIYDTLAIDLVVGFPSPGRVADHTGGPLSYTVSDFGQSGFAAGSLYNLGQTGLVFSGSDNLLFESGIVLGRNSLQVSSSLRSDDGSLRPSDFVADEALSEPQIRYDGGVSLISRCVDANAEVSIPVAVRQETIDYGVAGDGGLIICRYHLVNTALSTLSDLYFGFFADLDLSEAEDNYSYYPDYELLVQQAAGRPFVGLVKLSGLSSFKTLIGDSLKSGWTKAEQFDLIRTDQAIQESLSGDLMSMMTGGPYNLAPGDSTEVALALIAGNSLEELLQLAILARDRYLMPTDVETPLSTLPNFFRLEQNYPNPFNPSTTISFELSQSARATLDIFNLLGQKVVRLHEGPLAAGIHDFVWDATGEEGSQLASGVYFYRLSAGGEVQSRKMVLLR